MRWMLDPDHHFLIELGVDEWNIHLVQAVWYYNSAVSEERSA